MQRAHAVARAQAQRTVGVDTFVYPGNDTAVGEAHPDPVAGVRMQ
jgi:hypothetical protein